MMKKKKVEASKKIVIACYVILMITMIATYVALFMDKDISSATQIVLAIIGLVATANTAYFTKAAIENRIKILKAYEIDSEVIADMVKGSIEISNINGMY